MKTLSIQQPYASLVINGDKEYETRSWSTNYRGPLAIHAGKKMTREMKQACAEFMDEYPEVGNLMDGPLGCVLGIVELINVIDCSSEAAYWSLSAKETAMGFFGPGRYAWKMLVVEKFDAPVPAIGSLGLFEWAWDATAYPAPRVTAGAFD